MNYEEGSSSPTARLPDQDDGVISTAWQNLGDRIDPLFGGKVSQHFQALAKELFRCCSLTGGLPTKTAPWSIRALFFSRLTRWS